MRLRKLEPADLALVTDERNRRVMGKALARVVGRELELEIESGVPEPRGEEPEPLDPFTTKVADLFEGRVEEP
ncbi:MAG: hypothetical protein ACYTFV_07190 [Planctomycetota bacterium]